MRNVLEKRIEWDSMSNRNACLIVAHSKRGSCIHAWLNYSAANHRRRALTKARRDWRYVTRHRNPNRKDLRFDGLDGDGMRYIITGLYFDDVGEWQRWSWFHAVELQLKLNGQPIFCRTLFPVTIQDRPNNFTRKKDGTIYFLPCRPCTCQYIIWTSFNDATMHWLSCFWRD